MNVKLAFRHLCLVGALVVAGAWAASAGELGPNVEFAPIETMPKEFPRFFTPITGTLVRLTASLQKPVPVCLPNSDEIGSTLTPGAHLTLFGITKDVDEWGAFGAAVVSEDGSEICTVDGSGVAASGLYVMAVRTSDIAPGLADIVDDLGDASPLEPTGLFCNVFTEFLCNRTCEVAYSARVSICRSQLASCQNRCSGVNSLFRPTCRLICANQSAACSARATLERQQCRRNCQCR